ncbi:hypothetical protein SDC9_122529 [bioreactor metagenome]|uniref:Uncharacterized protein n=1 Tax=bioreactor metagenome TaxID=1076179 RepID=A0A645CEZ1_9ZZZZ
MTGIEGLGRDVGNGLHRARHRNPDRMLLVKSGKQVRKYLPGGVVLDHADFLTDDALLLIHAFLCKIGDGDEGEQNAQVLLKFLGAFKIISGNGV